MSKVTRKKTSCYCINLRRAANWLTTYYDSILKPLGISITQYSLLSSLSKLRSCTANDLAIHVGLERTTVVRTIKPLLEKSLVEDIQEKGVRKRKYQLTEKGNNILDKARPLWQFAQKDIEDRFGVDKLKVLVDVVSDLIEYL